MRRFYRRVGAWPLALIVLAFGIGIASAAVAATSSGPDLTEVMPPTGPDAAADRQVPGSQTAAHAPVTAAPDVAGLPVVGTGGERGVAFAGLTFHNQRRDTDGGNQLSLEPPDQGICVGNGKVIEAVNDTFSIYDAATGAKQPGFESMNQFFIGDHQIVRSPSVVFGEFLSDPRCLYDADSGRFFMTTLAFARDPSTGAFEAPASFRIAVSKSSTPSLSPKSWTFTTVDVTNDGRNGEQSHPNCPCFGDQPLVGIDHNGVYVTTNEFPINGPGFNGAQIYAIGKAALIQGGKPNVVRIEGAPIDSVDYGGGFPYSLQPAVTSETISANNGTEYLVGALEFGKQPFALDDRIAVWALTNTASLNTRTPDVHLSNVVITSQVYGFPPAIVQPNGPTPNADSFGAHEDLIDGGDDRMQAAVWAHGHLWAAADTIVKTPTRGAQVGETYYMIDPIVDSSGTISAATSVVKQGYVAVNGNSITRPSLGVTSTGKVVLGGTLAGPDYFPSAEYTTFDDSPASAPSAVHVTAAASVPDDGFTGFPAEGGNGVGRWGDYAFTAVDGNSIWVANEWIPGLVQGPDLANWGTYVTKVTP